MEIQIRRKKGVIKFITPLLSKQVEILIST